MAHRDKTDKMKRITLTLILMLAVVGIQAQEMNKRILVAYFSATGTTKSVAEDLAAVTGGDLFEIAPAQPYTASDLDWRNAHSRSSLEMGDPNSRPQMASRLENAGDYDIILLGFPIWWYVAPTIVNTFLESIDCTGKTIILFATSGGSGFGETISHLSDSAPGAKMKEGQILNGEPSRAKLKGWLQKIGVPTVE